MCFVHLVVSLELNGHAACVVVLFGVLVLVLAMALRTNVRLVLRVLMFVIPMFVTVSSVAVSHRVNSLFVVKVVHPEVRLG